MDVVVASKHQVLKSLLTDDSRVEGLGPFLDLGLLEVSPVEPVCYRMEEPPYRTEKHGILGLKNCEQ